MTVAVGGSAARRWAKLALRAVGSVAVMAWLLSRVQIRAVLEVMSGASPRWLLAALALHGAGVLLSAVRWQMLLEASGAKISLSRLAGSYLVGFFFNTWLPSGFGGDAVRAWDTRGDASGAARSVGVIVIERGTGILALFALGVVASGVGGWYRREPGVVGLLGAVTLVGAIGLALLGWVGARAAARLEAVVPARLGSGRAFGSLKRLIETSAELAANRPLLFKTMVLGVLLQLNVVLHYAWIGRALELPVAGSYYFLVVPIVIAVLTLPISINGIGARDAVFTAMLGAVGVGAPQALALSTLALGMTLVFSVLGGIYYVFRGARRDLDGPQGLA